MQITKLCFATQFCENGGYAQEVFVKTLDVFFHIVTGKNSFIEQALQYIRTADRAARQTLPFVHFDIV